MLEINVCEIFSQACCHQGAPVEQIGPFYHFSEASEGNRTENSFKLIQIYSTLIRSELSTVESKALRILYKGLKVRKSPTFDYVVVFYRTRVRSLAMLVTNSHTDSFTDSIVNLIDVTLACEDGNSKLVEVVTVVDVDDERQFITGRD